MLNTAFSSTPEQRIELWSLPGFPIVAAVLAGITLGALVATGHWGIAAAILAVVLSLRWPAEIALGAFACLVPFDSVSAIGSAETGATVTRVAAAVAAVVLLGLGIVRSRRVTLPRAAFWWSLFVIWGGITIAWAKDPAPALERLPTAVSLLVLYLAATSFSISRKELARIAFLATVGGCIAAGLAIFAFYNGELYRGTYRSSLILAGRETDPNQFAASLILPLALAIGGIAYAQSRRVRLAAITAVALLAFAILLTMSRGGMVAAFVVVFLYRMKFKRRVLVALVCLALLPAFMPSEFMNRLSLADRGAGRLDIWTASLSLLPDYGVIGAGWNNFIVVYTPIAGNAPNFHGFTQGSHNIFLGMIIEVGIIGLLPLLFAFRSQLREARHKLALLPFEAACWGILASGVFLDVVWRKSFWLCWILLAMAVQAYKGEQLESSR
jgi:O-antigen ligase